MTVGEEMTDAIESRATLRDDLIDRLAKVRFDAENSGLGPAWDQIDDEEWETYAHDMEPFVWVIVEVVAEWARHIPIADEDGEPYDLAGRWREDINREVMP